jgi:phosphoribosylaminoimidazole-succinocarboxamide synthase
MSALEGKTKRIEPIGNGIGRFHSKEDVTAGDGGRHDVIPGKGRLSNSTTCAVFDFLHVKGVPLAYIDYDSDTSFLAQIIKMIPVEIVVRNEAAGSYCKRNPDVPVGTVFERPVVEFYYKTTRGMYKDVQLECDDPLMLIEPDGTTTFHRPDQPVDEKRPMYVACGKFTPSGTRFQFQELYRQLQTCLELALLVNQYLKQAWAEQDGRLIDFKIECGVTDDNEIVVGDVIDCDSWRVIWNGIQLSKQPYRDGANPAELLEVYATADALVQKFGHVPELH